MYSPYWFARITRDLTNLSLLRQPPCHAQIVSLHQSGTHWLRHMLSVYLAKSYDLPEPALLYDSDFVMSPKQPAKYPHIPRIVSSHSVASPAIANAVVLPLLRLPKFILLVRDPRIVLSSHYEREKNRYGIAFSDYLRANTRALRKIGRRKRFDKDIWWDIRFQNSWYKILSLQPERTLLVRYEDMQAKPEQKLLEVIRFLDLPVQDPAVVNHAVQQSSKEAMAKKELANKRYKVVRQDNKDPLAIYSEDDKRFFLEAYRKFCKADFGYDLEAGW